MYEIPISYLDFFEYKIFINLEHLTLDVKYKNDT